MDSRHEMESVQFEELTEAFRDQLVACLEECAHGRHGLFTQRSAGDSANAWPEAALLRELALALQGIFAQRDERNVLCDEFLDLCTIHGESDPGERKLARGFLDRIEKDEVGMQPETEARRW
jgi:hypothetical protein